MSYRKRGDDIMTDDIRAADLLTIAEAAKLCEFSEPQIRARIKDGRLEPIRIGPNLFLDARAFEAYLTRLHAGAERRYERRASSG